MGRSLLIAAMLAVALEAEAAAVRVTVSGGNETDVTIIEAVAEGSEQESHRVVLEGGSTELTLELQSNLAWTFSVRAAGLWAAERTEWIGDGPSEVSLALLPTGSLRGKLLLASAPEAVPVEAQATFQPVTDGRPQEPRLGADVVTCPVDRHHVFQCELPAGRLDIKLRVRGYASYFLWSQEITACQVSDLGEVRLVVGSSVVGWVRTEAADLSGVVVAVEPAEPRELALDGLDQRAALRTSSCKPDHRGFFHLTGLAPGAYRIVASQPELVTERTGAFSLENGLEATWPVPIELCRPVHLEARLDPPRDPAGHPWTLQLRTLDSAGAASVVVARVDADAESGTAILEEVPRGRHIIEVRDRRRGYWFSEEVDIRANQPVLEIVIPVIRIVGRLRLGEDGLSAAIRLGNRDGEGNIWFRSDAEGLFQGSLPGPGPWQASIRMPGGSELTSSQLINLDGAEPGDTVEIEILLGDTAVQGTVVDPEGEPVAEAHLFVVGEQQGDAPPGTADAYSAPDGAFQISGLPAGRCWIQASSATATSDKIELVLEEGEPISDLRLVLRQQHVVTGKVVSAHGPVPGALVLLSPDHTADTWVAVVEDITGIDGAFAVTVPAQHTAGDLFVFAAGYTASVQRVLLPASNLTVALGQVGGALTVQWTTDRPGGDSPSVSPLIRYAGTSEALMGYTDWVRASAVGSWVRGGDRVTVVIPQMPPGRYEACMGARVEVLDSGVEGPQIECVEGLLPPFGELVLALE